MSKHMTQLVQVEKKWVLARWRPGVAQYCVLDNKGGHCYGDTPERAIAQAWRAPLFGASKDEALEFSGTIKELEGVPLSKIPVQKIKERRTS